MPPTKASKGKAVDPSERTRLLPEGSLSSRSVASESLTAIANRSRPSTIVESPAVEDEDVTHTRRNRLITALIVICSILFGAILFLGLLLSSYIPSSKEKDNLPDAVAFHGPTDVNILNVTTSGIWVEVEGYVGVDVDRILGIDRSNVHEGERGGGARWWERLRTDFGRLAVDMVGPVEVGEIQGLEIWSTASKPEQLVSARLPSVIPIPLAVRVDGALLDAAVWAVPPWLTAIRVPVHVRPEAATSTLLGLAKTAWKEGSIDIEIRLESVTVRSRHLKGWRRYIKHTERGIRVPLTVDVPALPGIPKGETDLTRLVRLESYDVDTAHDNSTSGGSRLQITALASAPNPVPSMRFDLPYNFGFGLFLPVPKDEESNSESLAPGRRAKMADVVTGPISLHGQQRINVLIRGFVETDQAAPSGEEGPDTNPALSLFLRNYLHGLDNPVIVHGLPFLPWNGTVLDQRLPAPPSWMSDIVRDLELDVSFLGPRPAPKLIKSITVRDMRISESRGGMRASGLVVAEIELPEHLRGVEVDVTGVLPDVLVFDGVPVDGGDIDPDEMPYPLKAFGRIHPDDYLPATSQPSSAGILLVEAPIHDVPVQVLPGRDKVMSDFVSKIIFKGGALAGIKGRAAVGVIVSGMASEVHITKISVSGEFTVGKPRFGL